MTFKNISNIELISRMEKLVCTERKITHLILQYILEIEDRKLYAEMGYDGMYTYLTRGLGYSEASAYRRLQAARLLKRIPEISQKVEEGSLNLSQLTQVQICLKEQNKKGDLLSHVCPDGNWSDVITRLAKNYNAKKLKGTLVNLEDSHRLTSSNRLTQSATARRPKNNSDGDTDIQYITRSEGSINSKAVSVSSSTPLKTPTLRSLLSESRFCAKPRKYISLKIKRSLLKKAQYCCEYRDAKSGKRCTSKYQLEFDHIQPWALGGSNGPDNLRVLCRKHNSLMAAKAGLKTSKNNMLTKIPDKTYLF